MILELNELPEKKNQSQYLVNFHNILPRHPNHLYTAVLIKTIIKKPVPRENSFFTAETRITDIDSRYHLTEQTQEIYILDSLSVLQSLRYKTLQKPLI